MLQPLITNQTTHLNPQRKSTKPLPTINIAHHLRVCLWPSEIQISRNAVLQHYFLNYQIGKDKDKSKIILARPAIAVAV